jgi:hypothetical protein
MTVFKQFSIFLLLLLSFVSCAPKQIIKVDLDTYLKNQQQYKGEQFKNKEVVITATLKDIIERYALYRGKIIELSAPVTYYGTSLFWTWYILLQKDGSKLRCYEDHYRLSPDWRATDAALQARARGDNVTVIGKLYKDGLELSRLIYDGYDIDTNYPVRRFYLYPIWR